MGGEQIEQRNAEQRFRFRFHNFALHQKLAHGLHQRFQFGARKGNVRRQHGGKQALAVVAVSNVIQKKAK